MNIASPKDLLTTLYNDWKSDLEKNLAEQAKLKDDEMKIRAVVETCEQAFGLLFPQPPVEEPPAETPTEE